MEQKRIKVKLTENSPYSDYGYYKKGDIGYIDGYVNGSAVIILENGKFAKADLRWIEVVNEEDKNVNTVLKESEDEKIRKAIKLMYSFLPNEPTYIGDVPVKDIFAWLEKQGKKTKPIEGFNTEFERQVSCLIASAMNRDYEYTKDFVKWTSEGLLNYAKREFEKNSMGISEATKKKLEDSLNEALEKETPESWNKFLDEQGEQKPTNNQFTTEQAGVLDKHIDKFLEQKPTWSEEDEARLKSVISLMKSNRAVDPFYDKMYLENWLKSLKDRVYLQLLPQQEWSKEDDYYYGIIQYILNDECVGKTDKENAINWFKSLRPQKQWKPSGKLIRVIEAIINNRLFQKRHLDSLYADLKKLKG